MAELTPIEEKLGEVLGLAQAAQRVTTAVSKMENAEKYIDDLERMSAEAAETETRATAIVDAIDGKKTAIHDKARETKQEAGEMMDTYLGDEEEALDGFEFLSMTEAGELCHWEIVDKMAETLGERAIKDLSEWVLGVQRGHIEIVRNASLELAVDEVQD